MLQPLSPRRCAILRGLFICRITWSFSTSGESDRTAGALRVALTSVCPQNCYSSRQLLRLPFSLIINRKRWGLCFSCLFPRHALLLNTDDNSMCCVVSWPPPPTPHPWTQTKTTGCSTGKHQTQVTQTSRIPLGNLRASKLHLIVWRAKAHISANWFIQNNTSEHINLYLRGDQM